jgi:hypothetical protein
VSSHQRGFTEGLDAPAPLLGGRPNAGSVGSDLDDYLEFMDALDGDEPLSPAPSPRLAAFGSPRVTAGGAGHPWVNGQNTPDRRRVDAPSAGWGDGGGESGGDSFDAWLLEPEGAGAGGAAIVDALGRLGDGLRAERVELRRLQDRIRKFAYAAGSAGGIGAGSAGGSGVGSGAGRGDRASGDQRFGGGGFGVLPGRLERAVSDDDLEGLVAKRQAWAAAALGRAQADLDATRRMSTNPKVPCLSRHLATQTTALIDCGRGGH